MQCQGSTLSGMADSVKLIDQSCEDLKATCAKSGSLNEQALAAIESTKQLLLLLYVSAYKALT
jgi:hypothetical protein